jgi:hypothetical protein
LLQAPSDINAINLNSVRYEGSRHSRNKRREYLKDKIDELSTNSKSNNTESGIEERRNIRGDTNPEII